MGRKASCWLEIDWVRAGKLAESVEYTGCNHLEGESPFVYSLFSWSFSIMSHDIPMSATSLAHCSLCDSCPVTVLLLPIEAISERSSFR